MSDNNIELSRRKILAGLGAVGAAGAGAGLGTSALFSDEETFEGNTITAGTLDLKVDWEEHYSYPQLYGFDDPTIGGDDEPLDVTRSEPDSTDEYQALPDPQSENPAIWVHQDDLDAYMDNTAIEAYPDVDQGEGGDGIQDPFDQNGVGPACEDGADTSEDLDPADSLRTDNADTQGENGGAPLVNLEDVKPGDFGELTLSYHLCSNPGYVWLGGELVEAAENGHTEPEADHPDEVGGPETSNSTGNDVELINEIEATVWYDGDCDNVFEPGGDSGSEGQATDIVLVIDKSGSMSGQMSEVKSGAEDLIEALGPNDQVGLVSFDSSSGDTTNASNLDAGLTSDHQSVKTAVNGLSSGGSTNMEAAVERAHEELTVGDTFSEYGESGNARSNAEKFMIFLGDGSENQGTDVTDDDNISPEQEAGNAKDDDITIHTIAYGSPGGSAETTLQNMASDPQSQHYHEADVSDIETVLENLGGTVGTGGEELITRGTLAEVLDELQTGDGIQLDGNLEDDADFSPTRANQTHCVGLSWHLPQDTGNHVQSDSVAFNVGFYAEQSRNNEVTSD